MRISTKLLGLDSIPSNWSEAQLNEVAEFKGGGTPSRSRSDYFGGEISWVKTGDLTNSSIAKTEERITQSGLQGSACSILPIGTLLIAMYGGFKQIGRTGILSVEAAVNQAITALLVKPSIVDVKYVQYWVNYNVFVWRKLAGSSRKDPNITKSDIEFFPILMPPLSEQKKIAEILGACDEAIEAQERLIAQKQQRKKGLMQKLLTGDVRFPEFEGTPWKEVRLGDVGKPYSGLTGKNKSDFGHGRPYISYMNVFSSSRIRTDILERVSVGPDEKQHAVQQGDFFFTISSETPNEVGMASVLLHKIEDTYLNSFCFGFRPHPCSPITPEYAQFCLRGQEFRRAIRRLAQGATRYNLSKGSLMLLSLKIPERDEQSAISSVLSACDEEITLQQSKLEQLKQQKKGLMQQLLTGKVRVKV